MAFQLNNMQYITENVNAKSFAWGLFTWNRWWWASNGWRVEADTCQSLVSTTDCCKLRAATTRDIPGLRYSLSRAKCSTWLVPSVTLHCNPVILYVCC